MLYDLQKLAKNEAVDSHFDLDNTRRHEKSSGREDAISLMRGNPHMILDVGCAIGKTGEIIKEVFPDCEVIGMELNPTLAESAKARIDLVIVGDVEKIDLEDRGIKKECFDYIIYGDILEHLYNPWKILLYHKRFLKSTGQIIASIPNIRNSTIIKKLLIDGCWSYAEVGLLDFTHIRFFTFNEIKKLFSRTGYIIKDVLVNLDFDMDTSQHQDGFAKLFLKNLSKKDILELHTQQFIIIAEPNLLNKDFSDDLADKLLERNIPFFEGVLCVKKKRFDAALKHFNEFLSLEPPTYCKIQTLLYLGKAYLQQGRAEEAIKEYNKALSLEPQGKNIKANILIQLANIYFRQGKFTRAEEEIKKALSLKLIDISITASIYYALGSNYEKKRLPDKAKEKFKEVIVLGKDSSIGDEFVGGAHFHLGCIYKELGKKEKAKREFEKCLRLIPDHKKAEENLKTLNL